MQFAFYPAYRLSYPGVGSFERHDRIGDSKELSWWLKVALQAMANDSDLNIENNIRKRDTQFINIFWLKTLENQIKCILLCILLEHTGGINMCFGMEHGLKHRKKRHNVFVRCFSTNN